MFSNSPNRKQRPLKIGEIIYKGQVIKVSIGPMSTWRRLCCGVGGSGQQALTHPMSKGQASNLSTGTAGEFEFGGMVVGACGWPRPAWGDLPGRETSPSPDLPLLPPSWMLSSLEDRETEPCEVLHLVQPPGKGAVWGMVGSDLEAQGSPSISSMIFFLKQSAE